MALSCFLALGDFSASAAPAPAASIRAELSGVVTDASGAAVPNATVSIETLSGKKVASTVTDASGHYRLEIVGQLDPHYREKVTAQGFRTAVEENLSLSDNVNRVHDVHLNVGSATDAVTVNAYETTGNGEIGTVAQAGILGTLSKQDLPFSVSSYTSQLVLDQQAQTVSDVLRNEVGIQESNGRYSENQYVTLRGFVLPVGQSLINGIPGLVDQRSPSIENIDRIEIFKGPSSFLNGASAYGAVAGTVNMVTKHAGDTPYYRVDGGYSSATEKEGHLDMGRRFLPQNALGVRLTLGGRMGKTPVDNQEENVGAGGLGVDYRAQKFHANVDISDQARSMLGFRDAIYVYPGFDVPKAPKMTSNIFDHSSSYTHHQQMALAQGGYDFNDRFQMYGSYGYAHELESYQGPGVAYLIDAQGDVIAQDLTFTSDIHTNVARLGTRLSTNTGPIHHDITLAGDYLQIGSAYAYEYGDTHDTNIYNPVALAPLVTRIAGLKGVPDTGLNRLSSIALADVATALHGKLTVIGGLRGQWIGVKNYGSIARGANNTPDFIPCTDSCSYNQGKASPSVAAMYHLPKGLSVYGNYIQDLQQGPTAPIGATNVNQVFAPYVATQKEVGAKYEHRSLEATLAIYEIGKPNGVLNPVTNVYGITGKQRNRGLEFTLAGNIVRSIRVNGGLSLLDARQRGTGDSTTDGQRAQGIPGTQSTVNAEWTVPRLKSLFLDARVTASSRQSVDTANTQSIPAWARLDIGGRYDFETKVPISLRVNLDNVTGNNYYESSLLGLGYAAPRTVRASAGVRF
ncbi:MAG: TonB-dependent receptor [Edaphobacter sp.]|uniref:TonB-dependent receptor n=1 Tax=Edaphobacter sp. TaxID=1934404 RepID=UPI00238FC873|nr:TonB-dependent receptor [Edaphobacter sp.]MDE1178208.1 TonB-dependent receptor [Edaphobacter sp.]